jgi:tetratricopeptide (TPR) repeat protein
MAETSAVVQEHVDVLLIRAERARKQISVDPTVGRRAAEAVADDARAAGDAEALVVALCAAGWAAREIYDHESALRCLNEAVRVARRRRLDDRLSEALVARAGVHVEYGRVSRARRDVTAARDASTDRTRAEVEFAEALLHSLDGNPAAAAASYRRALRYVQPDQARVRLRTVHNLALVELRQGRHDDARRLLDAAAELASDMDAPAVTAVVLTSQALAASERGAPLTALRRFDDAEALMESAGVPKGEMLAEKAAALLSLRLLDEAGASISRAVDEFAADDGRALMLAEALLLQGRIELARVDLDAAFAAASASERLFRRQRRMGWRAHATLLRLSCELARHLPTEPSFDRQLDRVERTMSAMHHLPGMVQVGLLSGQLALAQGRVRRARRKLRRVVDAASTGPILVRLQGRTAAALLADADGDRRRLGQVCRYGLDELGRYRATFASAELRARAWNHGAVLAELGLRAALRSGRPESVWCWLERGRAVVFVRTQVDAHPDIQPQLAALRQLEGQLAVAADDPVRTAELLRSIRRTERTIRQRTWQTQRADDHWALPTVQALRDLRHALNGRPLLQYGVIDGRVVGVVVTSRAVRTAELAAFDEVAASGRHLAFALRRLATPRSRSSVEAARRAAAHELATLDRLLIRPLDARVADSPEVIVAPPADLIGVPWGALPSVSDLPVRVVPSAVTWRETSMREPLSERVVAVAGPDLDGAADEVAVVTASHADAIRLTGGAATCARVRDAVSGARLVHLACHGRLRADSPAFSSLRLADGPLTVHELEHVAEPAHHWVLAACDLGAVGRLAGADLEGVLAALLFGGAAGVVAAGVSVPDATAVSYMADLHGALARGASLAEGVLHARRNRDATEPMEYVASVAFSCYGGG